MAVILYLWLVPFFFFFFSLLPFKRLRIRAFRRESTSPKQDV